MQDLEPRESAPARMRGAILPHEFDLLRFLADVQHDEPTWNMNTAACSWNGVMCNMKGEIKTLIWNAKLLTGILHWRHLPDSVEEVAVGQNSLVGGLPLEDIRSNFKTLHTYENKMNESLTFSLFSRRMEYINIARNRHTDGADLSVLPQTLTQLDISFNEFEGSLELRFLPSGLVEFYATNNLFSGEVFLDRLPLGLRYFEVQSNPHLRGVINLMKLPPHLGFPRWEQTMITTK